MIKNLTLTAGILFSSMLMSQVGINTDSPKATLDVRSVPADLTKTDGIIAPKLKGTELKAKDQLYATDQTGAMVYVTEALDASNSTSSTADDVTTKTAEVTTIGYYYFDGNIWKKIGGAGPWNISGTNLPAASNTQNIYQKGKIGIGLNPGANPNTNLYVNENTSSGGSGTSFGIQNRLISNKEETKTGIYNYLLDNSESGTGSVVGLDNTAVDVSKVARGGQSASFSYYLTGQKDNSSKLVSGLFSLVSVSAVGGELKSGTVSGNAATTLLSANTGNLSLTGDLNGYSGYGTLNAQPGYVLNASGSASGGKLVAQTDMRGGTVNATTITGTTSGIEVAGTSGTLNVSDYAAPLRSYIDFASTNLISANINALYGLLVEGTSGQSQNTIGKSYGIYIKPFRFTGDTEANAYNLYSEGENTKNYFQGRVGLGTNAPVAKLHVVKSTSDLTPAIISGCNEYSDNAAALAAGLPSGALYRTGDILKVVH
ncbi:hypothetical protein QE441_003168 [Chryseobacterium sp. SORGH_AS909]|uniref:hypothetical protein n=1 Tax=unclassified Chryseobacterium TaxID=2593645 RepID=UPI00277F8CAF|nr:MULTISPECIES: hypothetical protein [unclassified Chryseobacterium]MDQ1100030.1 hypothetical protein [Chryseobacterium sp. SORGH_AS_1048]MDR6087374.1 hypothetical protein [Chryseobacterium sp. SORGH_AS_0909]MDR6131749.1 hypothetical protein [Chryseobacterium sp. SORGH_AS_1175]MDT3406104.1 hypothetical protein [Pseudacidovorax intermedius]